MEFRSNIIFSVVIHATIFMAILVLAGGDAVLRVPDRFIAVTLFEHATDAVRGDSVTGLKNDRLPAKRVAEPATGLREALPAEVPPAAKQKPVVKQQIASQEKGSRPQDGLGLPKTGRLEGNEIVSLGQNISGFSGIAPQGVQFAEPGKAATRAGLEVGRSGMTQGDHSAINAIKAAIERAKSYPLLARKRGLEGTVTTEFTIGARGYPENIRIVQSSGYEILDAAAKRTLKQASPFPVINGHIEVPITFRIER